MVELVKQMVSQGGYVGTADVQQFFSVKHPDVVRRWAREGAPHLRVGHMFRWNVAAVERWLNEQTKLAEEQSAS